MSRRTRAREIVLKCLYAFETLDRDPHQVFEQTTERNTHDAKSLEFASDLYFAIVERLAAIDKEIESSAEHWDIGRFAVVDKNILRMAVCEILHFPDIPAKVSINEAIELAKKYSTMDSAGFVNGILDAIYRQHAIDVEEGGRIRTE